MYPPAQPLQTQPLHIWCGWNVNTVLDQPDHHIKARALLQWSSALFLISLLGSIVSIAVSPSGWNIANEIIGLAFALGYLCLAIWGVQQGDILCCCGMGPLGWFQGINIVFIALTGIFLVVAIVNVYGGAIVFLLIHIAILGYTLFLTNRLLTSIRLNPPRGFHDASSTNTSVVTATATATPATMDGGEDYPSKV